VCRVFERTATGVQVRQDGVRPLDEAMPAVLESASFQFSLAPLPAGRMPAHEQHRDAKKAPPNSSSASNPKRKQEESSASGSAAKRKKGSARPKQLPMPPQLQGQHRVTPGGRSICFKFNMEGCPAAPPGQACARGLHVCSKPNCYQPHSQKDCPKA
jgi:hypothetical protein